MVLAFLRRELPKVRQFNLARLGSTWRGNFFSVGCLSCAVYYTKVPRVEIFMSMIWEQSLDSAAKLQTLRDMSCLATLDFSVKWLRRRDSGNGKEPGKSVNTAIPLEII